MSKMATNLRTTGPLVVKSNPVLDVPSTSSTYPNPAPPPYPHPQVPTRPSANAPPSTLHTPAAPSLHPRSSTPSQPNRTSPVAYARQITQPPPASMTWPNISKKPRCTRCATSHRPRPSARACRPAAPTARRRHHCPVSAIRAPRARSVAVNATASPAAAPGSRSIAAARGAVTRTTAHRPVPALIPRVRVTARKTTGRGGRGGRKSSLLRIMRANRDTWTLSPGTRPSSRGDMRLRASAEGRGDDEGFPPWIDFFFGRILFLSTYKGD